MFTAGHAALKQQGDRHIFYSAMRKTTLLILTTCLATCGILAQNQYDYSWVMGIGPNLPDYKEGGVLMDFRETPVTISYRNMAPMGRAFAFTNICDGEGNLVLYTNSCVLINSEDHIVDNGQGLNAPGASYESHCGNSPTGYGYGTRSSFFLPFPGHDSQYVYFHLRKDYPEVPPPFYHPESFLYTVLDMAANNGQGKVTQKNVLIAKDTLTDALTAVRHGNGRDWWVVCPELNSDEVFACLLTPEGVQGPWKRKTPLPWGGEPEVEYLEQAVFSPNGQLYARVSYRNGVQVFHFDRCSGEFSDGLQLTLPVEDVSTVGLAISPNSRFAYVSTGYKVYQFDLDTPDVQASRTFIAEYDGHLAPLWTTFNMMQLAPDGKIYMNATNGVYKLHVIHNPNEKGLACNMEQHGVELPVKVGFSLPMFPHFRLLDLEGSPCDTLGISAVRPEPGQGAGISIYPNPAQNQVTLSLMQPVEARWVLADMTGRTWREGSIAEGQNSAVISIGSLPSGVYVCIVRTAGGALLTHKVVIQH